VTSRPATYTVRPGDSLSAISARLFGSAARWPYLYDANEHVVGGNPDVILVGEVLRAELGGHPAYGRVTTTTTTAYHAPWHANHGDGDGLAPGGAYCSPHCFGDGDGDGFELDHLPGQAAVAVSSGGYQARRAPVRSYGSSGGYGHVNPGNYSGFQACVISRESGGNSQVMNSTGHYGLYQFSSGTWAAYGGNPADFGRASASEQTQVFDNAIAQGGQSNWSPYDGC
jgi:hypothetical protein